MSFRSRLLIAITIGALIPLAVAFVFVRRDVERRITRMYDARLAAERTAVSDAIAQESRTIGAKLRSIIDGLERDDRFRFGAVRRDPGDRAYVLDYAERAMRLSGLSMLQLQDESGRILSSGHFPREYDRLDDATVRLLATAGASGAITHARTAEGTYVALARIDSFTVTGKQFYVVGGIGIDSAFLSRFARGDSTGVVLSLDGSAGASSGAAVEIPFADMAANEVRTAQFGIVQSRSELAEVLRSANRWFALAVVLVVAGILALGAWLSDRLSRPLADLAAAATRIDLDGEKVSVVATRDDEVGTVARRLSNLSQRLGASAERLRTAERRATVGDMARQVNHDIKNGLIPIRNVLRHLGDVSEQKPEELRTAFSERRSTLDASVAYLDTLARNYARLTPRIDRSAVDVNAVAREAVATATAGTQHSVRTRLAASLPPVIGDAVVLRRILDNLIRNGIESLNGKGGEVIVASSRNGDGAILLSVADTGRGMSAEEAAHAFDDFFTTKESGTGLGLSVVRRLTSDLGGSVSVESQPGRGTTFTLELPV